MKKICLLLAALLFAIMPVTAFAEETEDTSATAAATDTGGGGDAPTVSFAIDNTNVYSGMNTSYSNGYTPTVSGGVATIVLPLIASGIGTAPSTITATPGLGETATSPFLYMNYQKTVNKQAIDTNGDAIAESFYLVAFDLALSSGRTNGVYPVTIDVQGAGAQSATFTCYVTIADGKEPASAETAPTPQSKPKVIVAGSSVSPSPAEAGGEFTAVITLKNTSKKRSVKNMTVTATSDCTNLLLLNESNIIYIDKLAKEDTADIELKYKADLATPPGRYTISLAMEYETGDAETLSSAGSVSVTVTQPLRVEMEMPKIEAEVNAGDTLPLSFQVMNLGRAAVYNVRVELTAPGLIPTGTAFIGNMEAGTAATEDMNVFIGTKNMSEGYEGEDKYGYTSGMATLVYEDAEGNVFTQQAEIYTNINEPVITVSAPEEEEKPTASQWWISVVIGGAVIAGLVIYLVMRKKREGKNDADF